MSVTERGATEIAWRSVLVGTVFALIFVAVVTATFLALGRVEPEISDATQRLWGSGATEGLKSYIVNSDIAAKITSML